MLLLLLLLLLLKENKLLQQQQQHEGEAPPLDAVSFFAVSPPISFLICRYQWQWVVLLPFIDKQRLLSVSKRLEGALLPEERHRNRLSEAELYVHLSHPLAAAMQQLSPSKGRGLRLDEEPQWEAAERARKVPRGVCGEGLKVSPNCSGGFSGSLFCIEGAPALGTIIESPVGEPERDRKSLLLSRGPPLYLYLSLCLCLSICLSASPSVSLSLPLSLCLSLCLPLSPSVSISPRLSLSVSLCLFPPIMPFLFHLSNSYLHIIN